MRTTTAEPGGRQRQHWADGATGREGALFVGGGAARMDGADARRQRTMGMGSAGFERRREATGGRENRGGAYDWLGCS